MNFIDTMETTGCGTSASSITYSQAPPENLQPDNLQPRESAFLFAIPQSDQTEIATRLSQEVRDEVNLLLSVCRAAYHASNKTAALRAVALRNQGRRGWSLESLSRKYYAYIASGDWRVLLDRAKAGPKFWASDEPIGLPPAFLEFWQSLCGNNQRSNAPAHRELLRIWKERYGRCPATGKRIAYHKIPGYDTWPEPDGSSGGDAAHSDHPKGWSLANLNRHAPSQFELKARRIGREPAAAHRRRVFTTRFGLSVGRFYLFDDLVYDKKVNWPGARQATRPLGLIGLDLFSACVIAKGFKPTLIDEEGTKRKLKERDMLWLVAHVLCEVGYRIDEFGTTLVVENGTAAIPPWFEKNILAATQHKVTVHRAGLSGEHMAGLFEGASKGNPRFKAPLEALINLIHNEGAALPGNVGKDPHHMPTEATGLERYNNKLLKIAESLPPERRALLQFPVLAWSQFIDLQLDIFHRINTRTDHALEGWEKCGHVQQEFYLEVGPAISDQGGARLLPSQPISFSQAQWFALSPAQRAALEPNITAKCRKLSPLEVWNAGASQLHKLGLEMLPVLLGRDFGVERTVRKGYITIEDHDLSTDPLRYPAVMVRPASMGPASVGPTSVGPTSVGPTSVGPVSVGPVSVGRGSVGPVSVGRGSRRAAPLFLDDGEKFITYLNPYNPRHLILTDTENRVQGILELQDIPCRGDIESVRRQLGAARKEESARMAPILGRALPIVEARRDMHRNNLAVINGQPVTPQEIEQAAALRARVKRDGCAALDDSLSDSLSASGGEGGWGEAPAEPLNQPSAHNPQSTLDDTSIDEIL